MPSAYSSCMPTTQSQIRAILTTEAPPPTAAEIARRLECSRWDVYKAAKKAGINLSRGPRPSGVARAWPAERFHGVRLTSQTAGAAGELIACADLMFRGWNVYRALSPNAPCDLIAWKGERILRIEVRSARRGQNGNLRYAQPSNRIYEVLALIDIEQKLEYRGPAASEILGQSTAG